LDADGHFDAKTGSWHQELRYEDDDGRIGGDGALDGGRTALFAADSAEPMIRYRWQASPAFGGDLERIELYLDTPGKPAKLVDVKRNTGKAEVLEPAALVDSTAPAGPDGWRRAVLSKLRGAHGLLGGPKASTAISLGGFTHREPAPPFDFRCYTNPVWALPVQAQTRVTTASGAVPPGGLTMAFRFAISMAAEPVTARIVPIDAAGNASGPGTPLTGQPGAPAGWSRNSRDGIASGTYTVTNAGAPIALSSSADGRSFVVILDAPRDAHANRLNAVAWRVKL
ncbi:MAG: hypothetical protein HY303_12220, partial [Candidatus Wallbacteria bacterium]|nr:hypothetical protein [Candidatus Wallbacteria bacterium]